MQSILHTRRFLPDGSESHVTISVHILANRLKKYIVFELQCVTVCNAVGNTYSHYSHNNLDLYVHGHATNVTHISPEMHSGRSKYCKWSVLLESV